MEYSDILYSISTINDSLPETHKTVLNHSLFNFFNKIFIQVEIDKYIDLYFF